MVPDCPICVPLGEHLSCGVVGKRARCVALGKNLIVQAAAHHSYCDLRIVVLCEQEETAQWEFCRWLPHCWDEGHTARLIANTPETIRALLERRGPLPGRAPGSAQRRVQSRGTCSCAQRRRRSRSTRL